MFCFTRERNQTGVGFCVLHEEVVPLQLPGLRDFPRGLAALARDLSLTTWGDIVLTFG